MSVRVAGLHRAGSPRPPPESSPAATPELTAGKTHIGYSSPIASEYGPLETIWDEVPDPPGTRGRGARRWAHDPHPWINTD